MNYDESNFCDIKEGIFFFEFDDMIDEIVDLVNMLEKFKKIIKRVKNLYGVVIGVDRLNFKDVEGNLVFGCVVVICKGKVLDLVYLFYLVKYEFLLK